MEDNRSIQDRLRARGVIVTETKHHLDNSKRLLTDEKGERLGFFSPLEALKRFEA